MGITWKVDSFSLANQPEKFFLVLIPFIILDLVLKAFALWASAQNKHKVWFIFLIIINSMGILPAIYLLFFSKRAKSK